MPSCFCMGRLGMIVLVGEDEKVECPECGEEFEGRHGLQKHIEQSTCVNDQKSFTFYFSENQIYKRMARETFGMIVLVGEDEEVDCPECGKECNGRKSLKNHITKMHERVDDSSTRFISPHDIHKKIASQWLGDDCSGRKAIQMHFQLTECSDKLSGGLPFPQQIHETRRS